MSLLQRKPTFPRDPARIQEFCDRLAAAWSQAPDLRFGQLMSNVGYSNFGTIDPFYVEDLAMIEAIEQHAAPRRLTFDTHAEG